MVAVGGYEQYIAEEIEPLQQCGRTVPSLHQAEELQDKSSHAMYHTGLNPSGSASAVMTATGSTYSLTARQRWAMTEQSQLLL